MFLQNSKKKRITEKRLLFLCIRLYINNVKNVLIIFLILLFAILSKHLFSYISSSLMYKLGKSGSVIDDCRYILMSRIAYSFFSFFSQYLTLYCGIHFQTNLSKKALENILKHDSPDTIDLSSGKTQFAISEGSLAMSKLFDHCILELLQKLGYFIADFCLIYQASGYSKIHLCLTFLISGLVLFVHIKGALIAMTCKKRMNKARGLCDKNIYEDIINYDVIKSFQTEDKHLLEYEKKILPWKDASIRHSRTVVSLSLLDDMLFSITSFIFVLILYWQGITDPIIYRNIYSAINGLERSMENISSIVRKYKEANITSRLILYYLEEINGFIPGTSIKKTFDKEIVFKNVGYSISNIKIFQNINFSITKGEKVCIFGRNGSGKSTLSKILMRLCYIDSGLVTIDGIDIYQILITNYRNLITYVPQDTSLFDETVIYNLSYGNNRSFSDIIEECKKMDIHNDILKLENGYNTYLGERGSTINGGLRQKIFYVRALLTQAQIYIFDEPTNNLDEQSAQNVIRLILGEKFISKTVIVICHDYDLVKKFPTVLKFFDGKIIKEIN